MKKLRNYVILFTLVVLALTFNIQGVKASSILFDNDTTEETENESSLDNEVSIENETTNESTNNSVIVNSLNNNLVKDNQVNNTTPGNNDNLPQTGENDIYIVSVVGAIALIIGSVAYIKSRKYDI